MRKRKSLVLTLAWALLLVISAPITLLFNKSTTASAAIADVAVNPVDLFEPVQAGMYHDAYTPKLATAANGVTDASLAGKGVVVGTGKVGTAVGNISTKTLDISGLTANDKLIEFKPTGSSQNKRSYRIKISDGINYVNVFFAMGKTVSGYSYIDTREMNVYVQASGQSKIGGLTNETTGTFVDNTADKGISVTGAMGTPFDATGTLCIYYDTDDKAIYTDSNGEKVLVRDLDAVDSSETTEVNEGATNGDDTAFVGFTDNKVTIEITHESGDGLPENTPPVGAGVYGGVITALNGNDLAPNNLGYLASYGKTTADNVVKGNYVAETRNVITGAAETLPTLTRKDGKALSDGEDSDWNNTVYDAKGNDVTATVLAGDQLNFTEGGAYCVYRTKEISGVTQVVTYSYNVREYGFENVYSNIFDDKATDGVGKAKSSLAVDLTTGASLLPDYTTSLGINNAGILLTYADVPAYATTGESWNDLGKISAHIPSINIFDNTKDVTLISATMLSSSRNDFDDYLRGLALVVYEKADPTNYFVVTSYIYTHTATNHTLHAQAATVGQTPWGTRGATATQDNVNTGNYNGQAVKFAYDKNEKAVYVNGVLVRDFDADDNTNGTGERVMWGGFTTDEVGVMLLNTKGGGKVAVNNIDGHDLTVNAVESATGCYTVGLNTTLTADNYNATVFAAIGEEVTVPAPTSKKLTGDFVERTDITVAKVKINNAEAVTYTAGTTKFNALAGINKIKYLDADDSVVATAYVKAYNRTLESAVTGGSAKQGLNTPFTLLKLTNDKTGKSGIQNGTSFSGENAKVDGLRVTAARPETVTAANKVVSVNLNKKLYIGDNTTTEPLIEVAHAQDYLTSVAYFTIVITDANDPDKVVKIEYRSADESTSTVNAYGAAAVSGASYVRVYVNDVTTQLRHNNDDKCNGGIFGANKAYYYGYDSGKMTIYYDSTAKTLSVGAGQSLGNNLTLVHLDPTDEQMTEFKYPAAHPRFSFSDEVNISFDFTFETDYKISTETGITFATGSGKSDASIIITNIDGQSLAQTNGNYTKTDKNNATNKIAATVTEVTDSYKVGDTFTIPAVSGYYDLFANGGIASGEVTLDSVKIYNADGTQVGGDALTVGGTYTFADFGTHTIKYEFENRNTIETTVSVDKKVITVNGADTAKVDIATEGSVGLDGSYVLSNVDNAKAVFSFTAKGGYAITSIKVGGVEKLTEVICAGDAAYVLTLNYADVAGSGTTVEITTANAYTVTFNTGSGSAVDSQIVVAGGKATAPTTDPTYSGHVFKGWFADSDCTTEFNFGETAINANTTVYAKWVESLTVTFNSQGGSTVPETNVESGNKISAPTDPTKANYDFGGWYKEAACTTAFDFETEQITSSMTLYAKWTAKPYTISYNLDGGSVTGTNPTSYTVETTAITLTAPSKTGYEFKGWYTDATFATAWNYTQGTTVGNVTLYAKFNINHYEVEFDLDGGMGSIDSQPVAHGGVATRPATDPTKSGYRFVEWVVASTNETYDFATTVTANVALKAKWVAVHTVSFNVNGGEGTFADQYIENGQSATEPAAKPVRTGYDFLGWFESDTATEAYAFGAVNANVTLTARWSAHAYTITYDFAGGEITHANPANYTVEDDDIVFVAPTAATKAGYTFSHWSMASIDTAQAKDVTVIAVWSENAFTVTFDVQGGIAIANQTVLSGGKVIKPADPTKEGYTFDGWYVGNTAYDFNTVVTADVTLTAKWTEVPADTTPEAPVDTDKKEGCGKEAVGTLAFVLTALGAVLVIKRK